MSDIVDVEIEPISSDTIESCQFHGQGMRMSAMEMKTVLSTIFL